MDGVEHVGSIAEALISVTPEEERSSNTAIEYLLSDAADSIYECLHRRNVVVTPTLVIYPAIAKRRAAGEDMPDEFIDFIKSMQRITYRLHDSGVTLVTGTDTSDFNESSEATPGKSLLDEMSMLEEAGVPPTEIIAMASMNAARAISVSDDTGSVQSGRRADFLLLSADPGESVQNFQSVVSVFQAGQAVVGTER
jgi:imidazolonepropionase-like amidohydrolase